MKIIIRTENDAQISDTIRKYIKQKILDIRKYVRDDGEIILTFSANEEGMNIVLEADFIDGRKKYTNRLNVLSVIDKVLEHAILHNPSTVSKELQEVVFIEENLKPVLTNAPLRAQEASIVRVLNETKVTDDLINPDNMSKPTEEAFKPEPQSVVKPLEVMEQPDDLLLVEEPRETTFSSELSKNKGVIIQKPAVLGLKLLNVFVTLLSLFMISFFLFTVGGFDVEINTYSIFLESFIKDFKEVVEFPKILSLGVLLILTYLFGLISLVVSLLNLFQTKTPFAFSSVFYVLGISSYLVFLLVNKDLMDLFTPNILIVFVFVFGLLVSVAGLSIFPYYRKLDSETEAFEESKQVSKGHKSLYPVSDSVVSLESISLLKENEPVPLVEKKEEVSVNVPKKMVAVSNFLSQTIKFLDPFNLLLFIGSFLLIFFRLFTIDSVFNVNGTETLGIVKYLKLIFEFYKESSGPISLEVLIFILAFLAVLIGLILYGMVISLMNVTKKKEQIKTTYHLHLFFLVTVILQIVFNQMILIPLFSSPFEIVKQRLTPVLILSILGLVANYIYSYRDVKRFATKIIFWSNLKTYLKEFVSFNKNKVLTVVQIVLLSSVFLFLGASFMGIKGTSDSLTLHYILKEKIVSFNPGDFSSPSLVITVLLFSKLFLFLFYALVSVTLLLNFLSLFSKKSIRKPNLVLSIVFSVVSVLILATSLFLPRVLYGDFYEFIKESIYTHTYWLVTISVVISIYAIVISTLENHRDESVEEFNYSSFFEFIFINMKELFVFLAILAIFVSSIYMVSFIFMFVLLIPNKHNRGTGKITVLIYLLSCILGASITLSIINLYSSSSLFDNQLGSFIIAPYSLLIVGLIFINKNMKRMEMKK